MSVKTKIVVLHMKEVIYTAIFVAMAVLLVVLLYFMFRGKDKVEETMLYTPGVYTSSIQFSNSTIEVEVAVDENHINNVSIANLDETINTMYPLMQPAVEGLKEQIVKKQSVENLTYDTENQYTSQILIDAIEQALEKAEIEEK